MLSALLVSHQLFIECCSVVPGWGPSEDSEDSGLWSWLQELALEEVPAPGQPQPAGGECDTWQAREGLLGSKPLPFRTPGEDTRGRMWTDPMRRRAGTRGGTLRDPSVGSSEMASWTDGVMAVGTAEAGRLVPR